MNAFKPKSYTLSNTLLVILICLAALPLWPNYFPEYHASYLEASKTLLIKCPNGDRIELTNLPRTTNSHPTFRLYNVGNLRLEKYHTVMEFVTNVIELAVRDPLYDTVPGLAVERAFIAETDKRIATANKDLQKIKRSNQLSGRLPGGLYFTNTLATTGTTLEGVDLFGMTIPPTRTNAFKSQTVQEPLRKTLVVGAERSSSIYYYSTNNSPTVYLTQKDYERLEQHDAILGFVKRVNDSAVQSPKWDIDYKSALYEAFNKEANTHLLKLVEIIP